jgi:hypothetical protein
MSQSVTLLDRFGALLARRLTKSARSYEPYAASRPELVGITLRPCDVLLVEGSPTKISSSIRYLTQSSWSHAALYVGLSGDLGERDGEPLTLVEAQLGDGVIASPLSKYASHNTRICRPIGLAPEDRAAVIRFAVERIGHAYDLKNIIDLIRYFLPQPPVPQRWRRRMIALGSGEPTRAICTTLIAQAFQSVRYPILPKITRERYGAPDCSDCVREIYEIRHHTLFAPRDFDISPYFAVIKPSLATAFDYRSIQWTNTQSRPAGFVDEPEETQQAA